MGGWMEADHRKLTQAVILRREQGDRIVELFCAQVLPGTQGGSSGGDSEDDFHLTKGGTRLSLSQ